LTILAVCDSKPLEDQVAIGALKNEIVAFSNRPVELATIQGFQDSLEVRLTSKRSHFFVVVEFHRKTPTNVLAPLRIWCA
ncbi:MAG: hypothetical protein ACOYD0_06140, partial [Candidatus Nanopelagicales bacterium]